MSSHVLFRGDLLSRQAEAKEFSRYTLGVILNLNEQPKMGCVPGKRIPKTMIKGLPSSIFKKNTKKQQQQQLPTAVAAAIAYEEVVKQYFSDKKNGQRMSRGVSAERGSESSTTVRAHPTSPSLPIFDLVCLGIGSDGRSTSQLASQHVEPNLLPAESERGEPNGADERRSSPLSKFGEEGAMGQPRELLVLRQQCPLLLQQRKASDGSVGANPFPSRRRRAR